MKALAGQLISSCFGLTSPEILTRDFLISGPLDGPLSKKDFLRNGEGLASYVKDLDPRLFNVHVDPFEPDRIWVSARFTGNGYSSAPEVLSFQFDPTGLCYRASVGYIADRLQGSGSNVGGQYDYLQAQGKPKSWLETKTLDDLLIAAQESLFPATKAVTIVSTPKPVLSPDSSADKVAASKPVTVVKAVAPAAVAKIASSAVKSTAVKKLVPSVAKRAAAVQEVVSASKTFRTTKVVAAPAKAVPAATKVVVAPVKAAPATTKVVAVPSKAAPAATKVVAAPSKAAPAATKVVVAPVKAAPTPTKVVAGLVKPVVPAKPAAPIVNAVKVAADKLASDKVVLEKVNTAKASNMAASSTDDKKSVTLEFISGNLAMTIMKNTNNARAPELINVTVRKVLAGQTNIEAFFKEVISAMGSRDSASAVLPDIIGSLPRGDIKSKLFQYFQQVL